MTMQDQQLDRYSRHILLPQLDYDGQDKIVNSSVLVLGAGGLGSSAIMYLAVSGVGHLTILDPDHVELSNLQRQIVHAEERVGMNKALSAKQQVMAVNSTLDVSAIETLLDEAKLLALIQTMDVVLDCTDNSKSRKLHNRLCVKAGKPLVSAAAIRFEGQMMVIDPKQAEKPCYECVYPDVNEGELSCSESGIFAPVVGLMGVHQALEALKVISGIGETLTGKLMSFDGLSGTWRNFNVPKQKNCPICGQEN
jgi:adenylyltransferase/sulfurtransferase